MVYRKIALYSITDWMDHTSQKMTHSFSRSFFFYHELKLSAVFVFLSCTGY